MVDRRIIQEWIEKADEDFNFATSVVEDSSYYAQICFHYQQAAEKYLKAFIVAHELEFKKVHDLIDLLNICCTKEPLLSQIEPDCNFLSRFYIDTRYPVHWPIKYTKNNAINAQRCAKKIGDTLINLLRKEEYI